MSKKKIILIAAGIVTLILLIFAGYKLYDGINRFSAAEQKMEVSMRALKKYYSMDPFPSAENIKTETDNITTLNSWYATLIANLKKGEIAPEREKSPSRFMKLLDSKKLDIEKRVYDSRIKLAEGDSFAMGFERYFKEGSDLPAPDDVPRLTQQLIIIENLCGIMIEEGVTEITKIKREIFENVGENEQDAAFPTQAGRQRSGGVRNRVSGGAAIAGDAALFNKNAGLMEKSDLFAKLHFVLSFKINESELINLLNRLAKDPMFVVVTGVSVVKQGADVKMPSPEEKPDVKPEDGTQDESLGSQPVQETTGLSRQQKIVSGPEFEKPLNVVVEVDVYRFRGDEQE